MSVESRNLFFVVLSTDRGSGDFYQSSFYTSSII